MFKLIISHHLFQCEVLENSHMKSNPSESVREVRDVSSASRDFPEVAAQLPSQVPPDPSPSLIILDVDLLNATVISRVSR